MKTLPLPLAFLCLLCATAFTAKAHSPPLLLADTITIQFNTGFGVDCNGSGRQCLSAQPMAVGETPSFNLNKCCRQTVVGSVIFQIIFVHHSPCEIGIILQREFTKIFNHEEH